MMAPRIVESGDSDLIDTDWRLPFVTRPNTAVKAGLFASTLMFDPAAVPVSEP